MQGPQTPEADRAAGVAPTPRASAPWRVILVEALADRRLKVQFLDGTAGEVDLRAFLDASKVVGTLFEALRDVDTFERVRIELGVVSWPNGADLAPDAMYDAIRLTGCWVVDA